jgi:hypothetical protein
LTVGFDKWYNQVDRSLVLSMSKRGEFDMTVSITIDVPPELADRLRPFQERLVELLERGLRVTTLEEGVACQDEAAIIEILTSNPTPDQVLALRPLPEFQARVSALLARSKTGELLPQENAELERYLMLEHLVRLAKVHAAQHLGQGA